MRAKERRAGHACAEWGGAGATSVAARLRRELAQIENGAADSGQAVRILAGLENAVALEQRDRGLQQARRMRDAILVLIALLGELDDLDAGESDLTAFAEVAGLFDDIKDFAVCGAQAMRQVASGNVGNLSEQPRRN